MFGIEFFVSKIQIFKNLAVLQKKFTQVWKLNWLHSLE